MHWYQARNISTVGDGQVSTIAIWLESDLAGLSMQRFMDFNDIVTALRIIQLEGTARSFFRVKIIVYRKTMNRLINWSKHL